MNKNSMRGIKMKEEHIRLIISGAVLIIGLFIISIATGFFMGRKETEELPQEIKVNHIQNTEPKPSETAKTATLAYYLINEEEGELRLYYVEGDDVIRLRSEEISTDIFPKEDIAMLSEGIIADTSEKALEVWENFIS